LKLKKDELPKYKAHCNFIKSSTRVSMERAFGMLKKRFKMSFKKVNRNLEREGRNGTRLVLRLAFAPKN
jgi:hypothetical protein